MLLCDMCHGSITLSAVPCREVKHKRLGNAIITVTLTIHGEVGTAMDLCPSCLDQVVDVGQFCDEAGIILP